MERDVFFKMEKQNELEKLEKKKADLIASREYYAREAAALKKKRTLFAAWEAAAALLLAAVLFFGLGGQSFLEEQFTSNEFRTDVDTSPIEGVYSLRPYHVYYDNESIKMECVVVNGNDKTMEKNFHFGVIELRLSDGELLAKKDYSLSTAVQAGQVEEITILFGPKDVLLPEANLRHIKISLSDEEPDN